MSLSEKTKSVHQLYHIILSPSSCPDFEPLATWAHENAEKYVVSYEYGTTGHKHIDAFVVLFKPRRQDKVRDSILKLYPDIPDSERKNCKVIFPEADPNPFYGFGYSLKEGIESKSNLAIEDMERAQQYYQQNKLKVQSLVSEKVKNCYEYKSLSQVAKDCIAFMRDFHKDSSYKFSIISDSWLVQQFLTHVCMSQKLSFDLFSKLNEEKLQSYVFKSLGCDLLTAPPPITPIMYAPIPILLHHEDDHTHPMLQ